MAKVTINKSNYNAVLNALSSAGLSGSKLTYALAQVAHETGGFNNKKIVTHNNASGITWINNPKKQPNAAKGNPLPEAPKYNYAKFDTLNDWAKDYIRIVGKALNSATSAENFAQKLKANKYYSDPLDVYSNALNKWVSALKNIPQNISENKNIILPLLVLTVGIFILSR